MNKNGINPISDLKYFFSLHKLFRREKPDAILAYTIKPVIYGSIAAWGAKVKNINAMITGVGYLFISTTFKAKILKSITKKIYSIALGCAHRVIFQNPDDLKEFTENKLVNKEKVGLVNGSGVDMNKFRPTEFPKETVFFMLARLLYSKGVKEYLEAAKIVKNKYSNVKFLLLGNIVHNMQDAVIEDDIKEFVNSGVVELLPETNDVAKVYAQSSVFVLPSYREGTPRSVLEAMAMGRPIITTDVPGCRETVVDNENGFLIPVKDIEALANAMEQFVSNPQLIKRMGEKSLQYCSEKFEVGNVNKKMLKLMNIVDD